MSRQLEFLQYLVYILIMMPQEILAQEKINQKSVGVLGGAENETVVYTMMVLPKTTESIHVNVTYHEESMDSTTNIVTLYPDMVSEVSMSINSINITGTKVVKKRVELRSDGGYEVWFFVTRRNYTEGFMPLRNQLLGRKYHVSTFCEFGGYCQFSITTLSFEQTTVYLKLPESVTDVAFCVGEKTFPTSTNYVTLGPYESLLVESRFDLTGTHIEADQNVIVIAGSRDMNVYGTVSHLIEQLLPVEIWGSNFIVTSLDINHYGDVIQITSSEHNTRVEMSGFPFFELPYPGMTVRRRLDFGMTSTISSNRPIQVIQISGLWYDASNLTEINTFTVAPAMAVVPAVEQFHHAYYITCGANKVSTSLKMFSASQIDLNRYADSTISLNEGNLIPYSSYRLYSANEFEAGHVTHVKSNTKEKFGGIMRCDESGALMPLGIKWIEPASDCTPTPSTPAHKDGIDNDCDGQIDEDYCFENKLVSTHYSLHASTSLDFHTENITYATVIKLRVQTCGTATVQLLNQDGGMYLLRLSRAFMVGYSCFPACNETHTVDVRNYFYYFSNCSEEVAFYWIRIMNSEVCANIGPFPDGNCSTAELLTYYAGNLTEMKVGGLMQNANIWIDIERPDCGGLQSDWRCDDAINNCEDYESGTCSNPDFQGWVNQNCKKFCGLCTPDGHGRKFLVTHPTGATETWVTVRNATADTFTYVAYSSADQTLSKRSSLRDSTGRLFEVTLLLKTFHPFAVIITDADAVVTAVYRTSGPSREKSFVVYPVDTLGIEYPVNIYGAVGNCDVIAIEVDTTLEIAKKNSTTERVKLELGNKFTQTVNSDDGVVFKAYKPFATFCSDMSTNWNQLLPKYSLGRRFVIPNVDPNNVFYLDTTVKVVATQDNTLIDKGEFGNTTVLNRGDAVVIEVDFENTESFNVTSNNPISVGLRLKDTVSLAKTYTILPSVDNFMDNPLAFADLNSFIIYIGNTGMESELWIHKPTEYTIPQNKTFALSVFRGTSDWVGGMSLMTNQTPSILFLNLAKESLCRAMPGPVADQVDNDCDGQVDEDACFPEYGALREDQDLDGGFGEDCYFEVTGLSSIAPPKHPYCGSKPLMPEIEIPEEECWKPCQCDCAWVEQLKYRLSLSPEETEAYNEEKIEKYQEDMKLDENQLASEVAKKQSATDSRPSSTTVGYAGMVFVIVVLGSIVVIDALKLFSYFFV